MRSAVIDVQWMKTRDVGSIRSIGVLCVVMRHCQGLHRRYFVIREMGIQLIGWNRDPFWMPISTAMDKDV